MTSTLRTITQKNLSTDGKSDTRNYILNILRQFDLNKVNNINNIYFIAEGGFGTVSTCKYIDTEFLLKTLKTIETKAYMDEFKLTYKFRNPGIPKVIAAYDPSNNINSNNKLDFINSNQNSTNNTQNKDVNNSNQDNTINNLEESSLSNDIGVLFEYVNGQTLNNLLYKREKGKKKKLDVQIPLIKKLYYMIQLNSILEFLHDHNLVHRDLKPDNIIIDINDNLKVIDFGISIKDNTVIDLNSILNSYTLKYVPVDLKYTEMSTSVESCEDIIELQAEDSIPIYYNITTAFDIWCLGLILAEVLLGVEPWNGKNEDKIIGLICEIEDGDKFNFIYPLPKREKMSYTTKEYSLNKIIEIVKQCTNYDPKKRPSTKEIKKKLWEVFIYEVKFDFQTKMELDNEDQEKFKENTLKLINNIKNKKNISVDIPSMNNNIIESKHKYLLNIENPLITIFKNSIRRSKTEIIMINEKIIEIENNMLEMEESNHKSSIKGKQYIYMTYNEFDDSILAIIFPDSKQVIKNDFIMNLHKHKNYKLKNPYCLNYKNRLYMIGGMIIDTKHTLNSTGGSNFNYNNDKNILSMINVNNKWNFLLQKFYLDIFGNNYFKTRKSIVFDYFSDITYQLPDMNKPRAFASAIVFKEYLVVCGDDETLEKLNISTYNKNNEFDSYVFSQTNQWEFMGKLASIVYSPVMVNYNNEVLYIISMIKENKLKIYIIRSLNFQNIIEPIILDFSDIVKTNVLLRGNYYNFSLDNKLFLIVSENHNLLDTNNKHYSIELSFESLRSYVLEIKGIQEIQTNNPFNIELEKSIRKQSKQNIHENNIDKFSIVKDTMVLFDNSFFIHNSLDFYSYDDDLYYFTLNILKKNLTIRSFSLDIFK